MESVAQRLCRVRWTLDDQQGSVFQLGEGEPSLTGHLGYGYAQGNVDFWSEHRFSSAFSKRTRAPFGMLPTDNWKPINCLRPQD